MSATVLYMSMSVDGFIAGPNEGPNNGLGDGGERLHDWLWSGNEPGSSSGVPGRPSGVNGQIYDEFMSTGAVVAGRGTFEPAGGWGGDHHDAVPIFVVARHEPPHRHLAVAARQLRGRRHDGDGQGEGSGGRQERARPRRRRYPARSSRRRAGRARAPRRPRPLRPGPPAVRGLAAEQIELQGTRVLKGKDGVRHLHYRVQR